MSTESPATPPTTVVTTDAEEWPTGHMAPRMEGRVVFVTGGTRGIGAAISRSFAEQGAVVAAGYGSDDEHANGLLKQLQEAEGTAIILITHDLGVVANICRRVNVMYAGRFVEESPVDNLFARPQHPYTVGLLQSIPRLDTPKQSLTPIRGQPPDLIHLPTGCAFHPRCPNIVDRCPQEVPPLYPGDPNVRYACFNPVRQ